MKSLVAQALSKLWSRAYNPEIARDEYQPSILFFSMHPQTFDSIDPKDLTYIPFLLKLPFLGSVLIPESQTHIHCSDGKNLGVSFNDPELKIFDVKDPYMLDLIEIFNLTRL